MKRILIIISIIITIPCKSQSSINQILTTYKNSVPINFGVLTLTSVTSTDAIFGYNYKYNSISKYALTTNQISKMQESAQLLMMNSINDLQEFNIIKRGKRIIVFSYNDMHDINIYNIVFTIHNGNYKYDKELSDRINKLYIKLNE